LVIEQEGHGVREDFAQSSLLARDARGRAPTPALYPIALGELRKNGVYPVAR
jgi:hypothetical protein